MAMVMARGIENTSEGDTDDDDDALGRVGDRHGRRRRLLDRDGRELVVEVEVEACSVLACICYASIQHRHSTTEVTIVI